MWGIGALKPHVVEEAEWFAPESPTKQQLSLKDKEKNNSKGKHYYPLAIN